MPFLWNHTGPNPDRPPIHDVLVDLVFEWMVREWFTFLILLNKCPAYNTLHVEWLSIRIIFPLQQHLLSSSLPLHVVNWLHHRLHLVPCRCHRWWKIWTVYARYCQICRHQMHSTITVAHSIRCLIFPCRVLLSLSSVVLDWPHLWIHYWNVLLTRNYSR